MAAHPVHTPEPEAAPESPLLAIFAALIIVAIVPIALVIAVPSTVTLIAGRHRDRLREPRLLAADPHDRLGRLTGIPTVFAHETRFTEGPFRAIGRSPATPQRHSTVRWVVSRSGSVRHCG